MHALKKLKENHLQSGFSTTGAQKKTQNQQPATTTNLYWKINSK